MRGREEKIILQANFTTVLLHGESVKEFKDFCVTEGVKYSDFRPLSKNKFLYLTTVQREDFISKFIDTYGYKVIKISENEASPSGLINVEDLLKKFS